VDDPSEYLVGSMAGAHVLIIDDDPLQCHFLARTVQKWGAVPFEAQAFAEAVRLQRECKPDIVLLDVLMPHVDGYKLAQMFKREARFVPILLLTALDDLDSKRRALSAGADEFLTKPVNVLELQIRLSSMLRFKKLADELASANARLLLLATIDPLTQLPNRRALMERLENEFARSARYRNALTCLMIDIDHFKGVNDTFGHPTGDRIIAQVGTALGGAIRRTDLAGRYGGEEFLVLAVETSLEGGLLLGERLRRAVVQASAKAPELPAVTVSIGVATTELGCASAPALVQEADDALYRAKRDGRDRVVGADRTPRTG
jgi:diguanylate cyclase (GGDEF)-like protein